MRVLIDCTKLSNDGALHNSGMHADTFFFSRICHVAVLKTEETNQAHRTRPNILSIEQCGEYPLIDASCKAESFVEQLWLVDNAWSMNDELTIKKMFL